MQRPRESSANIAGFLFCASGERERELSVGVNVIGARGGYYVFVTGVGVGGCVWGW